MEQDDTSARRSLVAFFALTFLFTTLFGGSPYAAVLRGSVVALLAWLTLPLLIHPVVAVVLDAMARDKLQGESTETEEKPG